MRTVFVDASYRIAIADPKDQWSEAAGEAREGIG